MTCDHFVTMVQDSGHKCIMCTWFIRAISLDCHCSMPGSIIVSMMFCTVYGWRCFVIFCCIFFKAYSLHISWQICWHPFWHLTSIIAICFEYIVLFIFHKTLHHWSYHCAHLLIIWCIWCIPPATELNIAKKPCSPILHQTNQHKYFFFFLK